MTACKVQGGKESAAVLVTAGSLVVNRCYILSDFSDGLTIKKWAQAVTLQRSETYAGGHRISNTNGAELCVDANTRLCIPEEEAQVLGL